MEQPTEYSFMKAPSATDRFRMLERRKLQKSAKLTLETLERAGVSFHVVQIFDEHVLVARIDGNDIAAFPYYDGGE